jgi:hypothetical protein
MCHGENEKSEKLVIARSRLKTDGLLWRLPGYFCIFVSENDLQWFINGKKTYSSLLVLGFEKYRKSLKKATSEHLLTYLLHGAESFLRS